VQDFDALDPFAALSFDNVSTLSFVPGAKIEIPVNGRWSLKPLGYLGWGTELSGKGSAWVYWTGVKSQLRFGSDDFEWALINSLRYVGYSVDIRTTTM
jgi:hypothetical protein